MKNLRAINKKFLLLILLGCSKPLVDPKSVEKNVEGQNPLRLSSRITKSQFENLLNCQVCHAQVFESWIYSAHGGAEKNSVFRIQAVLENKERCHHCHNPFHQEAQAPLQRSLQGVSCLACHSDLNADHFKPWTIKKTAGLSQAANSCRNCHDFKFAFEIEGRVSLAAHLAQTTYLEWQDYQKSGGTKSCVDCHFNSKSGHKILGPKSGQFKTAVKFWVEPNSQNQKKFKVDTLALGHRYPTGDIFRAIRVEILKSDSPANWSRWVEWKKSFRYKLPNQIPKLISDTRLDPGKIHEFEIPNEATQLRVLYVSEDIQFPYKIPPKVIWGPIGLDQN